MDGLLEDVGGFVRMDAWASKRELEVGLWAKQVVDERPPSSRPWIRKPAPSNFAHEQAPRLALTRRAFLERSSVIPAESEGGAAFAVAILASLMLSKNQKVSGPFVVDAGNGSVDAGR